VKAPAVLTCVSFALLW